jgi:translation elongation factor EF-Ts
MLTQIREKKLKKVTVEDIPKVSEMGEEEQNSLAAKIQQAMSIRRTAVVDDSDSEDEDWEI